MYKAFYAGMDPTAPLLALGLFVAAFLAISVRAVFFQRRAEVDELAALPLSDEPTRSNR